MEVDRRGEARRLDWIGDSTCGGRLNGGLTGDSTGSNTEGVRTSSPWTRSKETSRLCVVAGSPSKKIGPRIQGRILFKQVKPLRSVQRSPRRKKLRLNYRSNIAGIVKIVSTSGLTEAHRVHMRKTPFWLLFEAILEHDLNQQDFRKCDELVFKLIETYVPSSGSFRIGNGMVTWRDSDVRLIFGLQCGDQPLVMASGPRPPSDFIQRRCGSSRISSKLVKTLFLDAVHGTSAQDVEDAVKLLTLYVCVKLFFSTSGESVSWTFIRLIDRLSYMKLYNWTAAIRSTLMGSIKEFHRIPEKVTGCVVVLLYFLCEHTTLVDAANPDVFPRFLKWNVSSLLTKMRTVTLSDGDAFKVNPGRLQVTPYERAQLTGECSMTGLVDDDFVDMNDAHTVGNGGCEAAAVNVNDPNDASGVLGDGVAVGRKLFIGQPSGQPFGVDEMTEGNVRRRRNVDGAPVDSTNECTQRRIIVLEAEQKAKDFLIAKLEEQVAKLTKALEQQASNLFVGFNGCLKVKEDEIARLTNVVNDLRKTISGLEVQIEANVGCTAAGSPHANCEGNDSDSFAFVDEKNAKEVIHNVTLNAVEKLSDSSEANRVADVVSVGHVVGGLQDEGLLGCSLQNSFVRNIKGKMRRERKLPEYEYPMLRGQLCKVGTHDRQRVVGDVGGNCEIMLCDEVISIDGIGEHEKKRSGFRLNNRLVVWKLVNEEVKRKLCNAYERDGDEAVVWTGRNGDIFVYFSDIKNIVRQSVIRGNVIDACAELLVSKQNVLCGGEVFPEKSYFFSSVCLGMVNNVNKTTRDRYLDANMCASVGYRFLHFPICHKSHWTLVVYDTEVGSWKHYNSIRPRPGSEDTHYNEALALKENVLNFIREKQQSSNGGEVLFTQGHDSVLEVVTDSPQQRVDSPDCAIIVCYVMRQYVHHTEIKKTMEGTNYVKARATMVEAFVDHQTRGSESVDNEECGWIWLIQLALCFFA